MVFPEKAWFTISYGLICTSTSNSHDRRIYLWIPLIQKYKTLPDSPLPFKQNRKAWEGLAFGFVPEDNDYVVVLGVRNNAEPILVKSYNLITYGLDNHKANNFVDSWIRWTKDYFPPYVISPFVESLILLNAD
ncbi:uncharacterized protein LOC141674875 [Apium graveolens]|uniref:uncharacterized protein LOC141674875 n=1 Tax=Apium graveolens TaxID=4045 RepID=UPI003D7B4368